MISVKKTLATSMIVVLSGFFYFCFASPKFTYREDFMPEEVAMNSEMKALFLYAKLLCFGRYALEVPNDASLIFGDASFPSTIDVLDGGEEIHEEIIASDILEIQRNNKNAEITYNGSGPVQNSRQIRYYEGDSEKKYGLHIFKTYLGLGMYTFIFTAAKEKGESEESAFFRDKLRISNLREREADEVPRDSGYCIDKGFIRSDGYKRQEMISAGLYIPRYPDVTFSVHSNKNAYSDYPQAEFEAIKVDELSLLGRIKKAQDIQGGLYPSRTVLREGKRAVQHWKGEESLIRRADGTHDFEWAFVGRPGDVANPSEFSVQMFTKVAHNTVGAAEKSSLTDEEAIALWDKLLSGLKFRVKVPGAPEGSYYFLPGADTKSGAKP